MGKEERTKESEMIVLRPAVILKVVDKGTLTDCGAATRVLLLDSRLGRFKVCASLRLTSSSRCSMNYNALGLFETWRVLERLLDCFFVARVVPVMDGGAFTALELTLLRAA